MIVMGIPSTLILIMVIIAGILTWILGEIYHRPSMKLNEREKKRIKENGLIHFTLDSNIESIVSNGFKGNKSEFEKDMGNLIWFYIADEDIIHKWEIVKGKVKNKKNSFFNTGIIIHNISDETLSKMRIRSLPFQDNAVVLMADVFVPDPQSIEIWHRE